MNNREILFRGKRIDNGEWVEGYYCIKKIVHRDGRKTKVEAVCIIIANMTEKGYMCSEVNSETVGRYTGLTDKNSRKIFEGDIVKVSDSDRDDEVFDTGDISFKNGAWYLCGEILYWLDDVISFEFEVIGNLFDNPEMIAKEEDYGVERDTTRT